MDIPRTITVRYEYDQAARAWSAVADTGGASWGRTYEQARSSAREALALWYDLPDDKDLADVGVEVVDIPVIDGRPLDEVRSIIARRHEAERLSEEVAAESRRIALRLIDGGISMRDAGAIVGVTGGRVAQYASASDRKRRSSR